MTHVTPDMIRTYLFVRKWRLVRVGQKHLEFERRGPQGVIGLEVPADPRARDYPRRLSEVLVNLSVIEHRPQHQIAAEIVKFSTPTIVDQVCYLFFGALIFGASLYSWLLLWGVD